MVSDVVKKALMKNSSWEDKDELLDVVYWFRQLLAVVLGILFGVFPLAGIFGILLYCGISTLSMHFYVGDYQQEDLEEYGGFFELAKEGFMSAFASFLVVWIIVYSTFHSS